MKKFFCLQSLVLLAGTVFAGYTIAGDFVRFYHLYGTVFRLKDCAFPNPVLTPCFWGGWAFLIALVWSFLIMRMPGDRQKIHQKYLVYLLIAGTIFGWANFGYGWVKFLANQGRPTVGCSGQVTANPFTTPCFFGSLFFTASLASAVVALKKNQT